MSFPVACTACDAKFNMPARLWNERVAGRVTVIHCRKCRAPISLDGTRSLAPIAEGDVAVQDTTPTPEPSGSASPSMSPKVRSGTRVELTSKASTPTVPRPASVAPKLSVPRPASVAPKPTISRPASVAPKLSVPRGAEQSNERGRVSTRPTPHTLPLAITEPVVRESPEGPPDSSPSLRALEVPRGSSSSQRAEAPEEAELADDFSADRTPAGILVDPAAIGRQRRSAQHALPAASAVIVAMLGAGLCWQAARMGTAAAPVPAPAAVARGAEASEAEREPEREPEPKQVAEPREPAPGVAAVASPEVAYDAHRLDFALRWAHTHAERCHRGGRAVGTAQLAITFSPEGKVAALQLTGEPIASAPVARCVVSYFQSMIIPAFEGEAFTIHETLTLR